MITIARESIELTEVECIAPELKSQINQFMSEIESSEYRNHNAAERLESIVEEIVNCIGYTIEEREQSWGTVSYSIQPVYSDDFETVSSVKSICNSLGFEALESSTKDCPLEISVPQPWRYLPFSHPSNNPSSDIVITEHSDVSGDLVYVEIGSDNKAILDEIKQIIEPADDLSEKGTLSYDYRSYGAALSAVEHVEASYSVYKDGISAVPQYEWAPDAGPGEYIYLENNGRSKFTRHTPSSPDETMCGEPTEEFRVVLKKTVDKEGTNHIDIEHCC
jgi:hypothetical protein